MSLTVTARPLPVLLAGVPAALLAAALIAVGAVAEELLAAASVPLTESILAASGLTNRELRSGARRRRLVAQTRKGGANQRTMDRAFFFRAMFVLW